MHQGWPKLASHLWMATPDGGLAAVVYAPSVVQTQVSGTPVRVELVTHYPFDESLVFKVSVPQTVEFPLYLRVPSWAKDASLQLPDGTLQSLTSGSFHKITRRWNGKETLVLKLPMSFRLREGFQNSVSVERGPLVYSLRIREGWKAIQPYKYQPLGKHENYFEVFPESPWNCALAMDLRHPEKSLSFQEEDLKGDPFTPEGVPEKVFVKGRRLDDWVMSQGAAEPPPFSPVISQQPIEDLVLVPYGSTRLRVTEFPVLK
jgi:hypothetical protein